MDIVYPLKNQPQNEELRYSLRSLENLPHDNVWLVGNMPRWAWKVSYIPTRQDSGKYGNALGNIVAACQKPELTDEFILMNDDFFVLSPQHEVVHYDKGDLARTIATFSARSAYWQLMVDTLEILRAEGVTHPKFYGIHIPTVLNKERVLTLVKRFEGKRFMLRTLYHNLYPSESVCRADVKKHQPGEKITETDYLSTSDAFARSPNFKAFISSRFPEQSPYEKYYG